MPLNCTIKSVFSHGQDSYFYPACFFQLFIIRVTSIWKSLTYSLNEMERPSMMQSVKELLWHYLFTHSLTHCFAGFTNTSSVRWLLLNSELLWVCMQLMHFCTPHWSIISGLLQVIIQISTRLFTMLRMWAPCFVARTMHWCQTGSFHASSCQ